jgi:hypothetical protein
MINAATATVLSATLFRPPLSIKIPDRIKNFVGHGLRLTLGMLVYWGLILLSAIFRRGNPPVVALVMKF